MNVPQPIVELIYNGKDITKDVSQYLIRFTYNDKTEGASDEITMEFEDTEGLWKNSWYPAKKDKIKARIGIAGEWLECGTFEVDEIEFTGAPDVLNLKALAAGVSNAVRTKNSRAFEKQTLRQIVDKIAQANGLTVDGSVPDVKFNNLRQYREHDLSFLRRVADDYGCMFSIRDKKITFTQLTEIETGASVTEIDKTDLESYTLRDKSEGTYKSAQVKYHDPVKNKTVQHKQMASADPNWYGRNMPVEMQKFSTWMVTPTSTDSIEIRKKAETPQQAEAMANVALYRANSKTIEGRIRMSGNTKIIAGNNFSLTGLGKLSCKYHIKESIHTVTRGGGYDTEADIKAINQLPAPKHKPKKVAVKPPAKVGGGFGRPYYNDNKFV